MGKFFLFYFSASLIIVTGICCASSDVEKPQRIEIKPVDTDSLQTKDTNKLITLMAAGDIMFGSNYPSTSSLPPNDGKDLLMAADSLLRNADITFGNVEGVFLDTGGTPKGNGTNVYCFRQPSAYARYYKESGFDLLSIANNHMNDFGERGIASTDTTLRKLDIAFAGSLSRPTAIIERKGLKIGFTAFAPHTGCLSMHDTTEAIQLVRNLKKVCALVIVSFHAGAEGKNAQHVPKRKEIFYDQDRGDVHAFAHAMVDAGADVVLGHGPHVARALELYQSRLIAYSLGNFCTYGQFNLNGVNGYAPLLEASFDETGRFKRGFIHSFLQLGEGGPVKDPDKNVAKIISALTLSDFPETKLLISEDGKIEIKE